MERSEWVVNEEIPYRVIRKDDRKTTWYSIELILSHLFKNYVLRVCPCDLDMLII